MHNHQGSMIVIILMLMSFLMISATFLWRSALLMHDSAIARQQYMYTTIALEDLLYYTIAQVQKRDAQSINEHTFAHWPLHTHAQWYWNAKISVKISDGNYRIRVHLYDSEQLVIKGSCILTTTVTEQGDIWFIDAWTIE